MAPIRSGRHYCRAICSLLGTRTVSTPRTELSYHEQFRLNLGRQLPVLPRSPRHSSQHYAKAGAGDAGLVQPARASGTPRPPRPPPRVSECFHWQPSRTTAGPTMVRERSSCWCIYSRYSPTCAQMSLAVERRGPAAGPASPVVPKPGPARRSAAICRVCSDSMYLTACQHKGMGNAIFDDLKKRGQVISPLINRITLTDCRLSVSLGLRRTLDG